MAKTKPLKILIVEDEALLAMDLEMMVEDAGHVVVGEAASFDEVEAMAADVEPDLVLVDVHLANGSNGLDVSALVQQRWNAAIIIFLTANPKLIPQDLAGAHGVIPKPFSRNGFMSAMQYLGEGIIAPPPVSARPREFVVAKSLLDGWSPA